MTTPPGEVAVDILKLLCNHAAQAMTAEGIPPQQQHRIMNRILTGHPDGIYAHSPGPTE
jgi:hypothetical protein